MAKRRRKKPQQPQEQLPVERTVPKFEIGVKGDEFDIAYTRAAAAETEKVSALMSGLSRESKRTGLDLLNFAILSLLLLMMAASFAFLSRSGGAPSFKLKNLTDGSYLSELSEYYDNTIPFGNAMRTLGSKLGLCDAPANSGDAEPDPDPEYVPTPAVTTTIATEPDITTAPTTTETPTSAPITEDSEITEPETTTMYAKNTANIRLEPDSDSMILGYFYTNNRIEVIEVREDGWASIWYNGIVAYVHSDDISERRVSITAATTEATTVPEEEPEETTETTEETEPETSEETTEPELEEPEITTVPTEIDLVLSSYYDWISRNTPPAGSMPQTQPPATMPPQTETPAPTMPPQTEPPVTTPAPEIPPPQTEPLPPPDGANE